MNLTQITYEKYLKLTGDPLAASNLVLAEAMEHQPPDFLTVGEAAKYLRVSEGAIRELCNSGKLTHHRIGAGRGTIRIQREELKTYQAPHIARTPKEKLLEERIDRLRRGSGPRRGSQNR